MGKKIYFTFNPAPPYFTFPFHLRESARSLSWDTVPSRTQSVELLQGFYLSLKNFLGISGEFQSVLFNSEYEFRSFIADAWFGQKSFHPVHGNSGMEFIEMLKARKYHPGLYPVKNGEYTQTPEGSSVHWVANEPEQGSSFGIDHLKKFNRHNTHGFVHADLSSYLPGAVLPFEELQSFSFGFNNSFGLPFNTVIWLISRNRFNEFMLKYEGRFPANKLCTYVEPCFFYHTPDYLFLDVARKILDDFNNRGLKNIINETLYKAAILKKAVSMNPSFIYSVRDESMRSITTITLDYIGKSAKIAERFLKSGMVVDTPAAGNKEQKIRITNFPVHSKEQFEALADLVEAIR